MVKGTYKYQEETAGWMTFYLFPSLPVIPNVRFGVSFAPFTPIERFSH